MALVYSTTNLDVITLDLSASKSRLTINVDYGEDLNLEETTFNIELKPF